MHAFLCLWESRQLDELEEYLVLRVARDNNEMLVFQALPS